MVEGVEKRCKIIHTTFCCVLIFLGGPAKCFAQKKHEIHTRYMLKELTNFVFT